MTAYLGGFSKGVKSAQKQIESFAKEVSAKVSGLAGVLGIGLPLSLGAAAAGFAAMAKGGLDRVDALNDAAVAAGTTADALNKLRYEAQLTGSSGEALDMGLQKMTANLGDAAVKATPAGEAIKSLGLDAKELAEMDPAEAFRKIQAGMAGVQNPAERAAKAMDIFGKGGLALMGTLRTSSTEMAALDEQYKKLGLTVSSVDVEKIGATKDSLDNMGAVVEGLGNQFAGQLAPYIQLVTDMFTDWVASWGGGGKLVEAAIDGVVSGIGFLADAWVVMKQAFAKVVAWMEDAWGRFLKFFGWGGQDLIDDAKMIAQGLEEQLKDGLPSEQMKKSFDEYKKKIEETAQAKAKLKNEDAKAAKVAGKNQDNLKKQTDAMKKLDDFGQSLYEENRTPLEKYREQIKKIGDALAADMIDEKTANRAAKKAFAEMDTNRGKLTENMAMGSKEALSTILSSGKQSRLGGMDAMAKGQGDLLAEDKKQTGLLETIAKQRQAPQREFAL